MSSLRSSDTGTESAQGRAADPGKQREVPSDHVIVGQVLGPWGRHGELKLRLHTSYPARFAPDTVVYLDGAPITVQGSRPYKTGLLVRLGGVSGRGAASRLRDAFLTIPSAELPELDDATYYHFQIVGLEVLAVDGERLGVVREILETGSNDVYVVGRESARDLLVPAIADVVIDVDVDAGRMTVDLPEGLA